MATRKHGSHLHTDRLPGEDEIARLYHTGSGESPSPALDARILAEARAATAPTRTRPVRWAVPLSTAAVVVLAVGVALMMSREGALNHRAEMEMPNEYSPAPARLAEESPATANKPASPAPLADAREERLAKQDAQPRRAEAPSAVAPPKLAESVASKPVAEEKLKKAEVPAAASPMLRSAEAERKSIARENRARAGISAAGALAMKTQGADVHAVEASGSSGSYMFNVTIKSPDTGCKQYADWWEVLSEDGKLLYRRVLFHSHVGEQPFTRDGGPVPIKPETVVWVRAHMNTSGYGGAAMKGSVSAGFKPAAVDAGFAADVAKQPPLPDGCAF